MSQNCLIDLAMILIQQRIAHYLVTEDSIKDFASHKAKRVNFKI